MMIIYVKLKNPVNNYLFQRASYPNFTIKVQKIYA